MNSPSPALNTADEYFGDSETYKLLFSHSHKPLVIMDPETGCFIDCNEAAVRAYGLADRAEVIGKTPLDVSSPLQYDGEASAEAARRHIDQALTLGSHLFEWRHQRPDGRIWDAEVHLMTFRYGKKQLMQFSLQEITERRRREAILQARLRLSEFALSHSLRELLRQTVDEAENLTDSRIGFFHFLEKDEQTLHLQTWSTRTVQTMCKAGVSGMHYDVQEAGVWVDCVHQRRPVIHNAYQSLSHRKGLPPGHAPVERELVVPVIRGSRIVAILGIGNKPTDYGTEDIEAVSLLADLAWDITERKRSEEAMQEMLRQTRASQERISIILSALTDGLLALDGTGRVTLMNPAAERLFDTVAGNAAGKAAAEVIPIPELAACCLSLLAGSDATATVEFSIFDRFRREDRAIQARVAVLPGSGETKGGVIAVLFDVTREREVDRLKSEFVTTAAHELRTPLTSVLGYAELLLEAERTGAFSTADRLDFIAQILEKGEVLSRIIDDFLDLGRIESGRSLFLEKTPCDLSRILHRAVDHHRRETSVHLFEVVPPPQPVCVSMDKTRILQVLENLLTNAVKYSPAGGTIRVEGSEGAGLIKVSVTDQGIGMTPEQVARIFEKFYRADTSTTAVGGLGLGMPVAKIIVEAHGGTIWVESAPQRGTRVSFTLPL